MLNTNIHHEARRLRSQSKSKSKSKSKSNTPAIAKARPRPRPRAKGHSYRYSQQSSDIPTLTMTTTTSQPNPTIPTPSVLNHDSSKPPSLPQPNNNNHHMQFHPTPHPNPFYFYYHQQHHPNQNHTQNQNQNQDENENIVDDDPNDTNRQSTLRKLLKSLNDSTFIASLGLPGKGRKEWAADFAVWSAVFLAESLTFTPTLTLVAERQQCQRREEEVRRMGIGGKQVSPDVNMNRNRDRDGEVKGARHKGSRYSSDAVVRKDGCGGRTKGVRGILKSKPTSNSKSRHSEGEGRGGSALLSYQGDGNGKCEYKNKDDGRECATRAVTATTADERPVCGQGKKVRWGPVTRRTFESWAVEYKDERGMRSRKG